MSKKKIIPIEWTAGVTICGVPLKVRWFAKSSNPTGAPEIMIWGECTQEQGTAILQRIADANEKEGQ
jgi:hypothetical protein